MLQTDFIHKIKDLLPVFGFAEEEVMEHFVLTNRIPHTQLEGEYFTNQDGIDYMLEHMTLSGDILSEEESKNIPSFKELPSKVLQQEREAQKKKERPLLDMPNEELMEAYESLIVQKQMNLGNFEALEYIQENINKVRKEVALRMSK